MRLFLDYFSELLLRPKFFFEKWNDGRKPKFFYEIFVIFCIGYGIDRIDRLFMKFDARGQLDTIKFLNNWTTFWITALVGGALGGYLLYLIGGWFFNVRVKWSNGSDNLLKSRFIYLYSNVFLYAVIILVTIFDTFTIGIPYDIESDFVATDAVSLLVVIFFIFYSIYLGYVGVIQTIEINESKAKIWFLLLPSLLYLLLFGGLIMMIFNYALGYS